MPQEKPLAQASAATNTTPQSVVTVKGRPAVQITYRLFAANTTAGLNQQPLQDAKKLTGFPYVLGMVAGGSLEPFDPRIAGLPAPVDIEGCMEGGVFREISADERTRRNELQSKAKDAKSPQAEREAAKQALSTEYGKFKSAAMHIVRTPRLIEPGTSVGICFGVDVKKKFRQYPLWQVTAGDNDIVVDVFETYGQHDLDDKATKALTKDLGTKQLPKPTDFYAARLTGAVWMRSTHPFGESDVDALPKDAATDTVKAALKRIYSADFDSHAGGNFGIDVSSSEAAQPDVKTVRLTWIAAENNNCVSNIKSLDVKKEVPRRIHPAAYAAVAKAAHGCGVTEIQFTSSWRPMLGSAPHRLGLGLDLKWLGDGASKIMLNRVGLVDKQGQQLQDKNNDGVIDDPRGHHNITVTEQKAFNEWKDADAALSQARADKTRADAALQAANKQFAEAQKKSIADAIEKAEHEVREAQKAAKSAKTAVDDAEEDEASSRQEWNGELNKNEPALVGRYRRYVMKEDCITQVLDPWYMAKNKTKDPEPNVQADALERQHNNHMHLSIYDAELKS